ncbi:hypothetical protein EsDP_00001225 [Epichloe bromicola]|uniref:Uncharacterized protein n=1 Tax=Epichloe bromicola TaxID=79588 RepID=A0ABQ0CH77_9HYPO
MRLSPPSGATAQPTHDASFWVPGTLALEHGNCPDIGFTAWQKQQDELGFSVGLQNAAAALNYGGLGIGCILFVPPCPQLAACVWSAATRTRADLIGSNVLSGLGGAVSETTVQITITDLYPVHHHARMNGWYLLCTFTGAYIGPVVSGATYMFGPPYNFSAAGVGLMNLAPYIGSIPGVLLGGYLSDRSIVWLSRRNRAIYEPEMRLWMAVPMAVVTPTGTLLCGLGLAHGLSWPIVAVGYGLFGFGLVVAGDVALSYAMDCYHDVSTSSL